MGKNRYASGVTVPTIGDAEDDYADSLCFLIGVAPITQVTHVRIKISNIQGSLNVIKVIFHTIKNCS